MLIANHTPMPTAQEVAEYVMRQAHPMPGQLHQHFGFDLATAYRIYDLRPAAFGRPGGRSLAWITKRIVALLKKMPKPRRGKALVYHGEDWQGADASEWTPTEILHRHGRELYVGVRSFDGKLHNVWLTFKAGENAPRDLYTAQLKRSHRW